MCALVGRRLLAQVYLWTCVAAGLAVLGLTVRSVPVEPWGTVALFGLGVVGITLLPVQVRHKHYFSMASALLLAGLFLWGTGVGVLFAAVHGVVASLHPKRQSIDKLSFNLGGQVLAIGLGAAACYLVAGPPQSLLAAVAAGQWVRVTLAFVITCGVYSASNTLLVAGVVSLHTGMPCRDLLKSNAWVMPYWGLLWGAAAAVAFIQRSVGLFGTAVFLAPVFVARSSFKLYVEKTKEAEAYVEQVNVSNMRLQEHNDLLSRMHEGALLLSDGLEPCVVRDRIRQVATQALGMTEGFLLEFGEPGRRCSVAWRDGEPSTVEPPAEMLREADLAREKGRTCTALGYTLVPLRDGTGWSRVLGVRSPQSDTERDSVLQLFASQVAVVLANADLFEVTRGMATRDGLTGLYNQRYMRELLDRYLQRAQERGRPLSLITLDMDNFKRINDRHGHPVGDAALRHMARVITEHTPPGAMTARNGGDEFVIILPDCSTEVASSVAAAILTDLQTRTLQIQGGRLALAASLGVATYPDHAATLEALISRSDQSAYISKRIGVNNVTVWGQFPNTEAVKVSGRPYAPELSAATDVLQVITSIVDSKDGMTAGHSIHVSAYAGALARAAGLNEDVASWVELAGLLHDLGKIAIPEHILAKPGPLTPEERTLVQTHPAVGADLMRRIGMPEMLASIVYFHHEAYGGGGYPTGARGEEIPLGARIVAICDAYDAMSSRRPYRIARSVSQVVAELRRFAGVQFDPLLVEIFIREVIRYNEPAANAADLQACAHVS